MINSPKKYLKQDWKMLLPGGQYVNCFKILNMRVLKMRFFLFFLQCSYFREHNVD